MPGLEESVTWDFERLTGAISYHRQPSNEKIKNGPSLVVLCTWMSANRKHIAKYTEQYRRKYPAAEILVVESSIADIFYRTNKTQQKRLRLARDIVTSHIKEEHPPILLHVFSNGGAQCAVQLATSLAPEHRRHAFDGIVFDSCPGEATYQRSVHAMSLSLPKSPIAQYLGPPLIHFTLCLFYLAIFIFRFETVITRSRRMLNSPLMFDSAVPRLYIFSKADELVPHEDVKSHAEDAKLKGYTSVRQLLFETSGHCAHAMAHKGQYWRAVDGVVEVMEPKKDHGSTRTPFTFSE